MTFLGWIFTFLAVVISISIWMAVDASNKKKAMVLRLSTINEFSPSQNIMGCDGLSGLAIDEHKEKICLITNDASGVSERVLPYKDIVSVELFEDGVSVTKTVRSSQVGGAIVGGLALGGVGAIIGGLSGKSETSEKVRRVELRLLVNDTKAPLHDVTFMKIESPRGGIVHAQAMQHARRWHGIVEVIIKRTDAEISLSAASERTAPPSIPASSVADEIHKLAELHRAGFLTMAEFNQQKARILDSNQATT